MTDDIFAALAAEFPREQVSWRAQNIKADGTTALALAYIDARDVMERLDAVLGAAGWSDSYDVHEHVTICTISVKVGEAWISKSDGAGDTDVEAEKGRLSDAFKRAAVKLGVGRYLYAIASPWVPCDSYKDRNDKLRWKRWTADPWEYVKTAAKPAQGLAGGKTAELSIDAAKPHWLAIMDALKGCATTKQLNGEFERHRPVYDLLPDHFQGEIQASYYDLRANMPDGKPKPPTLPKPLSPSSTAPDFDKLQNDPGYGKSFPGDMPLTQAQKIAGTP